MSTARTLIVGIGSPHGDDQAGWLVAERLATGLVENSVAVRKVKSPIQLFDSLDGIDRLVICDACRGLGYVGELRRRLWPAPELADGAWSGTHDLSLTAVLQLAERLGRLPQDVVIWSVEASAGNSLIALSPEVTSVLPQLACLIANEIDRGTNTRTEECTNNHS